MGKISGPCKTAAKRKFKVWPSAYASGWGVRCTKAGEPLASAGDPSLFKTPLPIKTSFLVTLPSPDKSFIFIADFCSALLA